MYIPWYDFPICHTLVRAKLLDVFAFKELVLASFLSFGHPEDMTAGVAHADGENIWADIFYDVDE